MNLLLLGKTFEIIDMNQQFQTLTNDNVTEIQENAIRDINGKVRVFKLRASAAREAHQKNGTVHPNKNTKQGGYIVKLNEETNNGTDTISKKSILTVLTEDSRSTKGRITLSEIRSRESGRTSESGDTKGRTTIREQAELTSSQEYSRSYGVESAGQENTETPAKNTISKIRAKQKQVKESIDKGIETGVSMAGSGESIGRDMGEKIRKRDGKLSVTETIGDGGEAATSISDKKEDDLKKVGINISTFKSRKPIG
jgi:hypothetical protein